MKVTKTMLLTAGMPLWDVRKFALMFPDGAECTPENVMKCNDAGLSVIAFLYVIASEDAIKTYEERRRVLWNYGSAEIKEAEEKLKKLKDEWKADSKYQEAKNIADTIAASITN